MKKRRRNIWTVSIVALCILLLIIGVVMMPKLKLQLRKNSVESIKDTIIKAAIQCYCIEGAYPSNLQYLEDNYGIQINHSDYIVTYEVFASNVVPEVQILVRGEG